MMHLLELPAILLTGLFADWLEIAYLVALDSACCSTVSRKAFWSVLNGHELSLPDAPKPGDFQIRGMKWFVARRLKAKRLYINGNFEIDMKGMTSFLRTCGATVETLWLNRCSLLDTSIFTGLLRLVSLSCRRLRILNITNSCTINATVFGELLAANAGTLQRLNAASCRLSSASMTVPQLPALQMLHIHDCTVNRDTLCRLISSCPNLRSFCCSDLHASDACLKALANHCPLLQLLSYENGESSSTASLIRVLQACPDIQIVDISSEKEEGNPSATDAHIAAIMQHCKGLKAFSVGPEFFGAGGIVSDASVREVATRAQELLHLCLHNCEFAGDAALLSLARNCQNLRTLDLSSHHGGVSQSALVALARNLRNMTELHIEGCKVGDGVLQAMATNCPRLHTLHLEHCSGYTEVGIAALAQGCVTLRKVYVNEYDEYVPPVARLLWQMLRPGVTFELSSWPVSSWVELYDIEREKVDVWCE